MIRLLVLVDGDVRLAEHDGLKPPPYAILSHRWGDEEVTYDEVQELSCRNKKGYQKVKWCGTRAKEDGYDYFWVDTCCINKTNNTEYAEAINSMFRWYKAAEICYAYLPDVNGPHGKEFEDSEWFERGWTLQELVASRTVRFYDSQSRYLGDKESLGYRLAHITKVHQDVLRDSTKIFDYSIAERMSWMAKRITTRIEDMAYSMLGIFGIDDMPMMYGQGETAFRRLQERIMERSNDFSIFAWRGMKENEYGPGLLATHPKAFEESGNIMPTRVDADYKLAKQMIEVGMRLRPSGPCTYIGLLPCISKFDGSYFGILLRHFPGSKRYARVADSDDEKIWIDPAQVKEFLPADRILVYQDIDKSGGTIDGINYKQVPDMSFHMSPRIRESSDNAQWASRKTLTRPSNAAPDQGILGDFEMDENEADIKAVRVGFDRYSNPVVMIARSSGMKKSVRCLYSTFKYSSNTFPGTGKEDPACAVRIRNLAPIVSHRWCFLSDNSQAHQACNPQRQRNQELLGRRRDE
jgi:hypothetical protein